MPPLSTSHIKEFLEEKYDFYNREEFIVTDPICIPHQFSKQEDIEIAAFLTASIAWGVRKTIIKNASAIIRLMDCDPYNFIMHAGGKELRVFTHFAHRTFNGTDCLFFMQSLQNIYKNYHGLKHIFISSYEKYRSIKDCIVHFREIFLAPPHEKRTEKHIANVEKHSSAKRMNMFLRWMVRNDHRGVDFGIWEEIPSSDLFIPLDVHTGNVARNLGLLKRKQDDWKSVEELTGVLQTFDPNDPVKYDYALFGLGVFEKFK